MSHSTSVKRKYCSQCAGAIITKCPDGDTCERAVCKHCGHIDYDNPKVLVACFVTHENSLLWIKRKCEPMAGYWFIPTGFMELGETPEQATSRELVEETGAVITPQNLNFFLIGSLAHVSEIYLSYYGEIKNISVIKETPEAMEVGLFTKEDAPWGQLAFPSVAETVELFYNEHLKKSYGAYKAQFLNNEHVITQLGNENND